MKILVCVKEVPSRESRYEIDESKKWIREENITFEINECDEYALEEALQLKESHDGEVVLLSLGRTRAEKILRKGLAMGADRAILVVDDEGRFGDPLSRASVLASVAKSESPDLILAGTQSDDLNYAQTGVMIATLLQIPHATIVMEVEANPETKKIKVLREMESGWFQWIELNLPALLTIQAGISTIRYASLKGIMQARKKELRKVTPDDLDLVIDNLPGLTVQSLYVPHQESTAELLEGTPEEVVETLVRKLRQEAKVL